jgi:NADPH2:quinone reductase
VDGPQREDPEPVRSKDIDGFLAARLAGRRPDQARADIAELADLLRTGALSVTTTSLPLTEAVEAHRRLEDRSVLGRIILS